MRRVEETTIKKKGLKVMNSDFSNKKGGNRKHMKKDGERKEKETISVSNIDNPTTDQFQFSLELGFILCSKNNVIAQQNHTNLSALFRSSYSF